MKAVIPRLGRSNALGHGPPVVRRLLTLALTAAACTSEPPVASPDAAVTEDAAVGSDAAVDAGAAPPDAGSLAELRFPVPEPWAEPIGDYLAAGRAHVGPEGRFFEEIHDLVVFEDRLYLGYGDADVNMGRVIPIHFRAFASPEDPIPVDELASDEEQLDRYRLLDGELFMAGVDATEDGWLGNVYFRRPGGAWQKSRTLEGGVHVHDVASHLGTIYAVGSGATREEWGQGNIYAHLWISQDRGERFEILERHHNNRIGDARWTRLLATSAGLYVFGYRSNNQGSIYDLPHHLWDGEILAPLQPEHPLRFVFVTETDPLSPELGLVRGVIASETPLRSATWRVAGEEVVRLAALDEVTVLDVDRVEATGELLLLVRDGAEYPAAGRTFSVRALVTRDLERFEELFVLETDRLPKALAHWRGHLFLGTARGEVWRSPGLPR